MLQTAALNHEITKPATAWCGSHPKTVGYLFKAKAVTQAHMDAAVAAYLADPDIGVFEVAPGCKVDLTGAVKASRHATAILLEPTAKPGSRRIAVKSAVLLARAIED